MLMHRRHLNCLALEDLYQLRKEIRNVHRHFINLGRVVHW